MLFRRVAFLAVCALAYSPLFGCGAESATDDEALEMSADSELGALGPVEASARKIAAGGFHTCVIVAEGTVKCWGDNSQRQLGNASNVQASAYPVDVLVSPDTPLKGAKAIYASEYRTCALLDGGKVACWGGERDYPLYLVPKEIERAKMDALGFATEVPSKSYDPSLERAKPLEGAKAMRLGRRMGACAIFDGDSVECWNAEHFPQSPTEPYQDGALPLRGTVLSAGSEHACAVTPEGAVNCWGANEFAQLGWYDTSGQSRPLLPGFPVPVLDRGVPLDGVKSIASGSAHTCALLAGGKIKCWGDNLNGQLGNGIGFHEGETRRWEYAQDVLGSPGGAPVEGASAIFAAGQRTCALFKGSDLLCWGGFSGKTFTTPTEVFDGHLMGLSALGMGSGHACAITRGGKVQCWGRNDSLQLGSQSLPREDAYDDSRSLHVVKTSPGGTALIVP